MTKQLLIILACLASLSMGTVLQAEEEIATGDSIDAANTRVPDEEPDDEEQDDEQPDDEKPNEAETDQQPEADNLKNRDLGAAFRSFRPSEEISADNAVPFPVDI